MHELDDYAPAPPVKTASPSLGAALSAEYEALRNDVQQATEMASDFQRQLAGKSNEFAELKRVFEKTASDLIQLQGSIQELREERHRLANEAMRAVAFEHRLAATITERDRLRTELVAMRHEHEAELERLAAGVRGRDEPHANGRRGGTARPAARSAESDVPTLLNEMSVAFERLRALIQNGSSRPAAGPVWLREEAGEEIAISFEK